MAEITRDSIRSMTTNDLLSLVEDVAEVTNMPLIRGFGDEIERLRTGIQEFLDSKAATRKANREVFPFYTNERKLCALLSVERTEK